MDARGLKAISVLTLCLLVAGACGQKPGVSGSQVAPGAGAGAVIDPATGQVVDPITGQVIDPATGNVVNPAVAVGANEGPQAAAESTTAEGGGSTDAGTVSATSDTPPTGGDASGVSAETIKIGFHDPLTGAAPIPADSAVKGADVYWKWLEVNRVQIEGRYVDAILRNDNYNPSQAVAVCKEMVEKDGVFLLGGHGGVDQMQACARYAASVGVPYVSSGGTELGMAGLSNAFAVTMSWPDQAPLLTDYLVDVLGAKGERNGMLRFDTSNFGDTHDAFVASMEDRGAELVYDRAVSKNAGAADAEAIVQEMKVADLDNVFVLTSPVWFIQVLQSSRNQAFTPQWVGVGVTMALDSVANASCRNGSINGAKFFSPFPAWVDRDRFDSDFSEAVSTIYPEEGEGDDIMLVAWGAARALHGMLELAGRNLTRERFIWFSERARNLKTGLYPPLTFSPDDHFGSSQVHLNEAQCSGYKAGDNRWHTISSFVSDF